MRTFDPTPYWRSTVGFDRIFDMLDQTSHLQANDTYPPYNIERADDYVQVESASFEDGLLRIDLVREVPEAMRPRRIAINTGSKPTIEHKRAA